MADRINVTEELNTVKYNSFPEIFEKMQSITDKYSNMPTDFLLNTFNQFTNDPFIQNRRVKAVQSLPVPYTKNEVEEMLTAPASNEKQLRQLEHSLEYTSYPLYHARTLYQSLLTYHSYITPYLSNSGDSKKEDFWREWKLLEKLRTTFDIRTSTREITGQAIQEGKVFYYPRISIDKAHNKVNHAFLQQMPSDFVKIIGFNNKSKYTLAFDLMYFTHPGTDPRQFGDLFIPYIEDFNAAVTPPPKNVGTKLVYASATRINMNAVSGNEGVEAYCQNGRWCYWVALPIDRVFTFEIDETNRNVVSPFTGLFCDMIQLVSYENVQLELVQNPLISLVLGEIPYFEDKTSNQPDQYKLSNAGRMMFEALWYQMLQKNNTGGIGFFGAPLRNMQLHQLAEAPSAMDISANGYGYALSKAGLSGIVPTSDDTRSGMAQISLMIESSFAKPIYACMERMVNCIIDSLNLKYSWRFIMFGTCHSDEKELEDAKSAMTLGILSSTLRYLALHDLSIFDDMSISDAIIDSGIMDKRRPLQTSYTMTDDGTEDEGGRPASEDVTSDGQEQDEDSYGEARLN